eukprot:scaffold2191_cov392-Prasinococcus_capsulatus_cf.AAC.12
MTVSNRIRFQQGRPAPSPSKADGTYAPRSILVSISPNLAACGHLGRVSGCKRATYTEASAAGGWATLHR